MGKVGVVDNPELVRFFQIKYLPTLFYFKEGKMYKQTGGQQFDDLLKFATEQVPSGTVEALPLPLSLQKAMKEEQEEEEKEEGIEQLTSSFFSSLPKARYWFVQFYAPWCGYCKKLKPIWNELAKEVNSKLGKDYKVAKIEASSNSLLTSLFEEVKGYPTLLLIDSSTQRYLLFEASSPLSSIELFSFFKEAPSHFSSSSSASKSLLLFLLPHSLPKRWSKKKEKKWKN